MLNSHAVVYLGSRIIAAAGNLLAVAVFSQLAGPAEYGRYVLIFAWSFIVYGFGTQWMRFAYFGVHQTDRIDEYAASLARLLAVALTVLAVGLSILVATAPLDPLFCLSVFALVCGMTVYEAAFEVTRTRMKAGTASMSMILRTCLIILLGSPPCGSPTPPCCSPSPWPSRICLRRSPASVCFHVPAGRCRPGGPRATSFSMAGRFSFPLG